jgi:uncharacterized protein (TIGR03435 family)
MTIWTYVTGWMLVHFVWQGTVIGLLAALLLRVLRGSSATARYATACVALGAMLLAPAATVISVSHSLDELAPLTLLSKPSDPDATLPAAAITTIARTPVEGVGAAVTVDALLPLLVLVWSVGVALLAFRIAGGAWRVHRIHRAALTMAPSRWSAEAQRVAERLGLNRMLRVVDAAMIATPTVVGYLRPVVLLPIAAFGTLSPAQVEAILAHELAHIRRHDGIVNLLQVLAETVLFYHPAVWWVSSRIRTEREHCCDDVAVAACGDPVRYAEALTELAAWSTPAPRLALSATSGSLVRRVRRILLPRRHAAPSRQGLAIAAIMIAFVVALTVVVRTQVPAGEIVTAMRDGSLSRTFGPRDVNRILGYELFPAPARFPTDDPRDARAWDVTVLYVGGHMPFKGFPARSLIRYAYDVAEMPVVGGPAWLDEESISFTANTTATTLNEDFRVAIREALERQFRLVTHRELRNFPAYALTLANGQPGPNLKPSDGTCLTSEMVQEAARSGRRLANGQRTRVCGHDNGFSGRAGVGVTPADLAASIGRPWVDREVVDQTGLQGRFDYRLDLGMVPLSIAVTAKPALEPVFRPFGVQPFPKALEEQLGLRLDETTVSHEVLVIDSAERLAAMPNPAPVAKAPPAVLERQLKRAPWAGAVERVARVAAIPAQTAPGSVSGTFTDQLNNFLPAVHLTLVNEGTAQRYDVTTGRSGNYTVSDLPAGQYQLTASLPGFRETTSIVTVQSGVNTERNVVMAIGMVEETIIVVNDGIPAAPVPSYQRRPVSAPPPQQAQGIGGNLRVPRKLRNVAPIYPASGMEGVVILTTVISADGTVTNTRPLSSPDPDLTQAAMDAVNLWEFDPTLLDGVPVDTLMQVTVYFRKPR